MDNKKIFKINQQAICYRYSCNHIEKVIEVFIGNNNIPIMCSQEGMKIGINGYSGELICPSFTDMCSSTVICGSISDCVFEKSERVDMTYNNRSITDSNIIKESNINSSNSIDNSKNTSNITNNETKPVTNMNNNTNQNRTQKRNSEFFTILLSYYIILLSFIVLL